MMAVSKITQRQEKQWQAEEDARAMARYQEIVGDKTRMANAVKAAQRQASDLSKRAEAMSKAANTKASKKR